MTPGRSAAARTADLASDADHVGGMHHRSSLLSLSGLLCGGLCGVGMPLLAVVVPVDRLGWLHDGRVRWPLLAVSVGMYGYGLASNRRRHGIWGPFAAGAAGAAFLFLEAAGVSPAGARWVGPGVLLSAWIWDWRLIRTRAVG